jgi:ferredoxin-NADP reductase/ferredoxin
MHAAGGNWRNYKVARRVRESETVVSLHLVAADGSPLAPFEPGQFLTFRLEGADGRPVPRNYSISSDPAERSHYRISVRREPGGFGSGVMHDQMPEGALVEASGPKGRFTPDPASGRAVLLLAGGIGITPLAAMAHALARQGTRPVWLIHACAKGPAMPFARELSDLADRNPSFRRIAVLGSPTGADRKAGLYQHEGRITRALLRSVLPLDDYEAYLCGPDPFMQAMFDALLQLGVRQERIAYEFFGPARVLAATHEVPAETIQPSEVVPISSGREAEGHDSMVSFTLSGRSALWDGAQPTLLDFAEAQGLSPPFSCRNGICNTCLCGIEGEVRYLEEPLEMPEEGQALLCCSVPVGPVRLRL